MLATHAGTSVFCLSDAGIGRTYKLYSSRPGPELNERVSRRADARARDEQRERADLPSGSSYAIEPVEAPSPLICVRIQGPLEQRAGYHDICAGWSDGHDAVCERLCAAFAEGDVLLMVDSPGGAAAGIQQNVQRALDAKAKYGRRVTVFADEMIGSAATWWSMALGDEIYGPPQCEIGSIGARGGHTSIAGLLAKDGIVVTYFADPPEKVALAPELPLSEIGASRGMRDVRLAADAFRAAICASPLGTRSGFTPEYLIELGADMLTGIAAQEAGLLDGIETLETVTDYALALAESGERPETTTAGAMSAKGERAMPRTSAAGAPPGVRAEDDKDKPDDDDPEEAKGSEPNGVCNACGMQNEADAKYCDQCGKSMAAERKAEEEEEEASPPSSKPLPGPERMQAPAKMSETASLASILGAPSDTPLALKTAAISLRQIRDTAAGVTAKTKPGEIVGELLSMPSRLEQADRAAEAERKRAIETEKTVRWDLAKRLNRLSLQGWPRSNIYVDEVSTEGKRTAVKLAPMVQSMSIDVLRGMVEGFEKSAKKPDPFQPSRESAEADAKDREADAGIGGPAGVPRLPNGEPTAAQIERAKKLPAVLRIHQKPGNTFSLDAIATEYLKAAAENGAPIGGTL